MQLYKGLKLAQLLGQLGVFLTWVYSTAAAEHAAVLFGGGGEHSGEFSKQRRDLRRNRSSQLVGPSG
jgi:hypothetical protein